MYAFFLFLLFFSLLLESSNKYEEISNEQSQNKTTTLQERQKEDRNIACAAITLWPSSICRYGLCVGQCRAIPTLCTDLKKCRDFRQHKFDAPESYFKYPDKKNPEYLYPTLRLDRNAATCCIALCFPITEEIASNQN